MPAITTPNAWLAITNRIIAPIMFHGLQLSGNP